MKLELRFGGLLVTAAEGDRFHLHTEPGATTSVAELYAIAQFLEALSRARAPKADERGRAPAGTAAEAALRYGTREPDVLGQLVPTREGAKSFVAGPASADDHKVLPESAPAAAQAVPRAAQAAVAPLLPAAASAPATAPAGEVKKPGRPIGGPQPRQDSAPGRPRTIALAAVPAVVAPTNEPSAAAGAAVVAQPKKPALPGRPRTQPVGEATSAPAPASSDAPPAAVEAEATPAAAKPVTKVPAQPAPKVRTGRLVDQLDSWMKANPGPRNRDELIQVSIDAGWLNADDAKRVFNMCMSRERELFIRTVDGSNEMYIRRAEALAPSSAPGKVVRRRPSEGGAS